MGTAKEVEFIAKGTVGVRETVIASQFEGRGY